MGIGTIILIVLALVAVWAIFTYNGLVTLRNRVANAWRQIDVQLKRRHDLIPNLVETVKGAMEFERDTLERVMAARARAMTARGPAESAETENALTQSLGRLFAVMENYPVLQSNQNALQLQEEITTTENQISFARQYYNDSVTIYNTRQQVFPANLIAGAFAFQPSELFNATAEDRETPKVDLTLHDGSHSGAPARAS